MTDITKLMNADRPFLTDGGYETWMFFVEGFEAPEFATICLLHDEAFRAKTRDYFQPFLERAEAAGTGFVLDTGSWRGCVDWAEKLGMSSDELLQRSRDAVDLSKAIRDEWAGRIDPILINGVVGPAGDGYSADGAPDADNAEAIHAPQIEVLADAGVDMISALTITNTPEAIGIIRATKRTGLPVVVSFTVETDGRLPSGQPLAAAIAETDAATDGAALYFMINCAHPDHFSAVTMGDEAWLGRIGGVRANASRLSHEELDNAEELDDGDPQEFGLLHKAISDALPALKVVGGCCGTDHRHVCSVADHLHGKWAA